MAAPKGNQFNKMADDHGGRPCSYTEDLATEICQRLSLGESLTSICKSEHIPSAVTVYAWMLKKEHIEFLNRYTQARAFQADTFIDQCIDIADETDKDKITLLDKDGEEYEKINFDHINRSRLRVDTRIKVAEKMAPTKYKPQSHVEHSGAVGIESTVKREVLDRVNDIKKETG